MGNAEVVMTMHDIVLCLFLCFVCVTCDARMLFACMHDAFSRDTRTHAHWVADDTFGRDHVDF